MFFPRMFSCQVASQVSALSCCTDPHACPGYGHLGTGTPSPMLIVTCVSMVGRIRGGFCVQLVFCRPTRALAQSHAGWSMYHLRRHRPFLHFSHERVLPAPSKQARRLNHGVPDLLQVVVHDCKAVLEGHGILLGLQNRSPGERAERKKYTRTNGRPKANPHAHLCFRPLSVRRRFLYRLLPVKVNLQQTEVAASKFFHDMILAEASLAEKRGEGIYLFKKKAGKNFRSTRRLQTLKSAKKFFWKIFLVSGSPS